MFFCMEKSSRLANQGQAASQQQSNDCGVEDVQHLIGPTFSPRSPHNLLTQLPGWHRMEKRPEHNCSLHTQLQQQMLASSSGMTTMEPHSSCMQSLTGMPWTTTASPPPDDGHMWSNLQGVSTVGLSPIQKKEARSADFLPCYKDPTSLCLAAVEVQSLTARVYPICLAAAATRAHRDLCLSRRRRRIHSSITANLANWFEKRPSVISSRTTPADPSQSCQQVNISRPDKQSLHSQATLCCRGFSGHLPVIQTSGML